MKAASTRLLVKRIERVNENHSVIRPALDVPVTLSNQSIVGDGVRNRNGVAGCIEPGESRRTIVRT